MRRIIIICFFSFFCCSALANNSRQITLAIDNYPPYTDETQASGGLLVSMLTEAFASQGIEMKTRFELWTIIQESLDEGTFFTIHWTKNRVLARDYFYSQALMYVNNRIATIKHPDMAIYHLSQLKKFNFGVTEGFSYGEQFEVAKKELNLVESDTRFTGLRGLIDGSIDFFLVDPVVANQLMASYFKVRTKKQITYIKAPEFESQPAYLVCSKNYANCKGYLDALSKGLAIVSKQARFQQLLQEKAE